MLTLAMTMGFGVTGVMLYMFTYEHQKQYAVLKTLASCGVASEIRNGFLPFSDDVVPPLVRFWAASLQ
ncbi:MAG: hypothetical protein ACREPT_09550 [Rudaea sp.]